MSKPANATLTYTPIEEIPKIYEQLEHAFASNKTRNLEYRCEQLKKLGYMIQDHINEFNAALEADLHRPQLESTFFETSISLKEVAEAVANIYKWTRTTKPSFDITWTAMRPSVRREPKGVVLIIIPFNFPLFLTVSPLVGAMAAGCCTVVKLPESTPHFSALFERLMNECVDTDFVRVVQGAVPETTRLLELRWDHIFYTGSPRVGRIVATAAAKHLTPVSLELGGKNPVFVDSTADLALCARRVLWGRSSNSGQVCLCPEYVLVPREIQDQLATEFVKVHKQFYPKGARQSDSYARLISPMAWKRVKGLLDQTKGTKVVGGDSDEADLFIEPTVFKDVKTNDVTMEDEIFGPILTLVPVDSLEDALQIVNSKPSPLALYIFSNNETFKQRVLDNTRSGSVAINEVVIQTGPNEVAFRSVGGSGYGAHRGKFGFDTFTHERNVIDPPGWIDLILKFRYPPYTPDKLAMARRALATKLPFARPGQKAWWKLWVQFALVVVAFAAARRFYPTLSFFTYGTRD